MSDRYLSIENARYIFNNMKNIGDEVVFKENGIIQNRAKEVLDKATVLLEKIEREGLFTALEKGILPISSVLKTEEKDWTAFVPRERTIAILL